MNRPWLGFYPENVPYEIEIPPLSVFDLLERTAEDYPTNKAVIDRDKELTYAELKRVTERLAAALHYRGFRKGDRLALMLPNSMEYVITYYAVHRLGGIVVQVNPMYQVYELEYILRDSEAAWFVGLEEQKKKLEQIGFAHNLKVIAADRRKGQKDSLYSWIAEENNELPPLNICPKEDIAVLQYTGGTTGKSKGVMLTHSNLVCNIYQAFTSLGGIIQRSGERMLGAPPLFHVYGMTNMNLAVFAAASYIAVAKFEVNQVLEVIRKYRPTMFPGVPTMYIALLQHPDLTASDIECFKFCNSGSAPMPVELMHEFERKTGVPILEAYGLSETSPGTHRNPVTGLRKPGSIGIPMPNTDSKIVDMETGTKELPVGEEGELVIKGPQVMKGYWKNPDETSSVLQDGWFYTGDIARMDENGYFYIVGRKKDLIIAGGYNIYPVEIEEVLYQLPAVAEACVYGAPDSYRGETVKAVIVPRKGTNVTEEEIINWCTERLAKYKIPRIIEFRDYLPKSTVGKILRRKLVDEEREKLQF
ncbi:long-chain acyl-CoA synthetase [Scopulibacillus darangshiensis]|uniref:Long-chain acyl-CoA synthetase n=1 Tax=Scopulibacillus darangshiensis TaxID=442528 RepID=A0A4R2NU89_9BACL|nr:long-chain fatty acid--CoA ligase [Scopulibacillus darangshiensis]TCP25613.1 long-chain acyl-CoA synthetase [Scopulibacillus darangshiensis]